MRKKRRGEREIEKRGPNEEVKIFCAFNFPGPYYQSHFNKRRESHRESIAGQL
jgi:hypothetical protein